MSMRDRQRTIDPSDFAGAAYEAGMAWRRDLEMPAPRDDGVFFAAWKRSPIPAGAQAFLVSTDGVVDLHPSQWSVR